MASISLFIIVFCLVAMSIFDFGGSYIGLLVFIIIPIFLILGLILIPIGMIRRSKKIKRAQDGKTLKGIKLDLTNKRHLNTIGLFVFVTFLFLFLTGIGSYEAFHYTESNEFCGLLCHTVMEPEYVAYQGSAHSRVSCVECHVGTGADWYVKSKLSGLYQVYSVMFNKYPKPIPTPIHNLRPARETCEECHWPGKFYSYRLHTEKHYLADSLNTEWNLQLKMKIGPEHSSDGLSGGIHWHINENIRIEYIALSSDRQAIPWVRYIDMQKGDTIVFSDIYDTLDEIAIDSMEIRTMDCLDCHNRPSHNYLPPQEFTDQQIASGMISRDLPGIKLLSMEIYNTPFSNKDTASIEIRDLVYTYYKENYPLLFENMKDDIESSVKGLVESYKKNIFPEMNASWDAYPANIGHVVYNGCFRCHNGNHESSTGQIITRDCDACHTILGQGRPEAYETVEINSSLEFKHPVDIEQAWKEMACSDCHRYLY